MLIIRWVLIRKSITSILLIFTIGAGVVAFAEDRPPQVVLGDKLDSEYQRHMSELQNFYSTLREKLQSIAPDLLPKLSPEAPKRTPPGYQILPHIKEEAVERPEPKEKFSATAFSWGNTDRWLKAEMKMRADANSRIASATRTDLEALIATYRALEANQKVINSQINYNRLWQGEIVRYRPRYEAATRKYNDLISGKMDPSQVVNTTLATPLIPPGPFLKIRQLSKTKTVIDVEMITDINDPAFIDSFKKAIAKYWRVDGPKTYEVNLKIKAISPTTLYNGVPPAKGAAVDLEKHIPRFPAGTVILTTGAATAYHAVVQGRPFIVLGVGEIPDRVLAHEFGHVLSLGDAYFRGFRDLGAEGFEILEIVPDLTDIMSAPGLGRVKALHFEAIKKYLTTSSAPGLGGR